MGRAARGAGPFEARQYKGSSTDVLETKPKHLFSVAFVEISQILGYDLGGE